MIPHHSFVGDESAPFVGYLLHGVLGAGNNFRSFAKRLVEAAPQYRFALIDLRYHGKSAAAPPPATLASCADDLADLSEHLGRTPTVVIGHSLGGKVALEFGRRFAESSEAASSEAASSEAASSEGESSEPSALRQVWALDSDPGPQEPGRDHQVRNVLASLKRNPGPFSSRDEAIQSLQNEGLSRGLAQWLATSLERNDERDQRYDWKFELPGIEALLDDYFSVDLWPFLEARARAGADELPAFEMLVAEQSDRWSGSMRQHAEQLPATGPFRLHVLPDAGHWVHVDNPSGLLEILLTHLPKAPE